jgi:hypothetical protein
MDAMVIGQILEFNLPRACVIQGLRFAGPNQEPVILDSQVVSAQTPLLQAPCTSLGSQVILGELLAQPRVAMTYSAAVNIRRGAKLIPAIIVVFSTNILAMTFYGLDSTHHQARQPMSFVMLRTPVV